MITHHSLILKGDVVAQVEAALDRFIIGSGQNPDCVLFHHDVYADLVAETKAVRRYTPCEVQISHKNDDVWWEHAGARFRLAGVFGLTPGTMLIVVKDGYSMGVPQNWRVMSQEDQDRMYK